MALRSDDVKQFRARFYALAFFAAIAFGGLVTRLYTLQILRGNEFSIKSEQNFVQKQRLIADRGLFYDAKGRLMVDNRPALDLYATPAFIVDLDRSLEALGRYLEMSPEEINFNFKRIKGAKKLDRFLAILIRRDLSRDQLELIEADKMMHRLDGFNVVDSGVRDYRYGKLLAHVTGYLNEISPQEFEQKKNQPDNIYELGDLIGRRGLERFYENTLRGKDGYERVVVDSKGSRQSEAAARWLLGNDRRVPAMPGHNLMLSIDLDVQRTAAAAFGGQAGAVIAVDVNTGFILALYSTPAYDPNRVTGRLAAKEKEALDSDPLKPWINRAIQEQYAPGSTYKPLTALTALSRGILTPETHLFCPGYFKSGGNTWHCFHEHGDGSIPLHQAIVRSCDVFFYQLGAKLGIEPLAETARLFGFGRKTEIPLNAEITGIVPDVAYHNWAQRNEGGYKPGFAINTAVGQGANAFTPLQLVMAYATIANGGTLYKPQLVRRIEDAKGAVIQSFDPVVQHKIVFKEEYWQAIKGGLCGVVNEPGGTAYSKRQPDVVVCGKTGTAQVTKLRKRLGKGAQLLKDLEAIDYNLRDNSWFVGFAPAESPQIAVVTLTEHGGFGGMASAPTVMAVIRAYLKNEHPGKEDPYYRADEDLTISDARNNNQSVSP